LLLTIAYRSLQIPATPERGAAVVKMWLANKGIDAPDLSIDNGSGLSRSERISALTLGRLLVKAYQSPTMPEFIASLPLAGLDGTMRLRLNGQSAAGRAHIKTGSLNQVRSIAGYVLAASGRRYAVVWIVNHANADRSVEAQDALLQWVHDNG
jgi:D-alanyl-D-alanine carboxypeptidase/D-alanyl-D-alanine-endopeptidase (penicillin-binding protein 4)